MLIVSLAAGQYASARAAHKCTRCPGGYYAGRGAKLCTSCPIGRYSTGKTVALTNCRKGICPPGKYSIGRAVKCDTCDDHAYQPLPGQSSCRSCATPIMGTTAGGVVRAKLAVYFVCKDIEPSLLASSPPSPLHALRMRSRTYTHSLSTSRAIRSRATRHRSASRSRSVGRSKRAPTAIRWTN